MKKITEQTSMKVESLNDQPVSLSPVVPLKGPAKQALASLKKSNKEVNKKGVSKEKATKNILLTNVYKGGRMGSK